MLQEMEPTAPSMDSVRDKGDNKFSGRNMSSPYYTPNSENSSGKNTDTVKSRTENNWLDVKESHHSHARRRLYESPDPARSDPKVPLYTKPKRTSWSFNNHSDSKPPSVSYPNEKVPYIIKPNESLPHIDGNWRTRTPEADTTIVKYGPTTTVKQGNTTTVFGSGSIHRFNTTEAAGMKFTKNENNKSDMNGASENFAASVDTADQYQGSEKYLYRNTNVSVTDFLTVTCLTIFV
jgi:hypothetical protein